MTTQFRIEPSLPSAGVAELFTEARRAAMAKITKDLPSADDWDSALVEEAAKAAVAAAKAGLPFP